MLRYFSRRYNYTTPKSFLEQIKLYESLLSANAKTLQGKMERLENGLTKLQSTAAQVSLILVSSVFLFFLNSPIFTCSKTILSSFFVLVGWRLERKTCVTRSWASAKKWRCWQADSSRWSRNRKGSKWLVSEISIQQTVRFYFLWNFD